MIHPHESMLEEFRHAIKHFVPTTPEALVKEANLKLEDLFINREVSVEDIKNVFYEIGRQEYPHRKAYQELTATSAKEQLKNMVIEHVDDEVRAVIKPHLDSGVGLRELVGSDLFEESLTPEQRYQVEDGIMVANDKLADALKEQVGDQTEAYQALVTKWEAHAAEIDEAITKLQALSAGGTEEQGLEIAGKATRLREGFLVTEQDPELEDVKKEIEYWTDTFAADGE